MKCLLLVAHGSRRVQSNDEVRAMAVQVQDLVKDQFAFVQSAFLELAEPSIPAGIRECVQQGASEVVIMPYFLSAGRHVVKDVPALVAEGQAQYPEVKIRFTPYLGAAASMARFIAQTAQSEQCLCGRMPQDCQHPTCLQA